MGWDKNNLIILNKVKIIIISNNNNINCNEEEREREELNPQGENQVKHNRIAHHLLTNAQPVPEQWSAAPGQPPPVYILSMTFSGMEYLFS